MDGLVLWPPRGPGRGGGGGLDAKVIEGKRRIVQWGGRGLAGTGIRGEGRGVAGAWRALARSWREQRDTAPRGLELALDAIANAERVSPAPDVEVLVEYAELLLFKGEVALATAKLREACSAAGRMPRHDEASLEAHQRARALLSACSNQTK